MLHKSGSIFVQIGDENLHRVRGILDEVFGANNIVAQHNLLKGTGLHFLDTLGPLPTIFFGIQVDIDGLKYRQIYKNRGLSDDEVGRISRNCQLPDGRRIAAEWSICDAA